MTQRFAALVFALLLPAAAGCGEIVVPPENTDNGTLTDTVEDGGGDGGGDVVEKCTSSAQCDDGNPCTTNVCTVDGVCSTSNAANGTECSDGNPATLGDKCTDGVCEGAEIDCSALDDECVYGLFDTGSSSCVEENRPEGFACDDGDPLTAASACDGNGACVETTDCSVLDDECVVGVLVGGSCTTEPANEGGACSDACGSGTCGGGECVGSCDDGDECTTDTCDGSACTFTPIPGCGTITCTTPGDCPASDDACEVADCQAGECVYEPKVGVADYVASAYSDSTGAPIALLKNLWQPTQDGAASVALRMQPSGTTGSSDLSVGNNDVGYQSNVKANSVPALNFDPQGKFTGVSELFGTPPSPNIPFPLSLSAAPNGGRVYGISGGNAGAPVIVETATVPLSGSTAFGFLEMAPTPGEMIWMITGSGEVPVWMGPMAVTQDRVYATVGIQYYAQVGGTGGSGIPLEPISADFDRTWYLLSIQRVDGAIISVMPIGAGLTPTVVAAVAPGDAVVGGTFDGEALLGPKGTYAAGGDLPSGFLVRVQDDAGSTYVRALRSDTDIALIQGMAAVETGLVLAGRFAPDLVVEEPSSGIKYTPLADLQSTPAARAGVLLMTQGLDEVFGWASVPDGSMDGTAVRSAPKAGMVMVAGTYTGSGAIDLTTGKDTKTYVVDATTTSPQVFLGGLNLESGTAFIETIGGSDTGTLQVTGLDVASDGSVLVSGFGTGLEAYAGEVWFGGAGDWTPVQLPVKPGPLGAWLTRVNTNQSLSCGAW